MKENSLVILIVLAVVCILAGGVWWTAYKYKDCKAVGHSTLYCVGKILSK